MPRGPKGEKRPADVIGNAVRVMQIATGEVFDLVPKQSGRAKSGKAGGAARAKALTADQRRDVATRAADARWKAEASGMDKQLVALLEKAKSVVTTEDDLEEHRIALAAANGHLSDSRITLDTMRATRTLMKAAEKAPTDK